MACDSCSVAFDGDPIDLIGRNDELASTVAPKYRAMVSQFWLCADCGPDYDYDPKQFFTDEVFDNTPTCASCDETEVESHGHLCDYCEADEASDQRPRDDIGDELNSDSYTAYLNNH